MIVEFGPNGKWLHVIMAYPADHASTLADGGDWVELVETANVDDLTFTRGDAGEPQVKDGAGNVLAIKVRLVNMVITMPAAVKIGEEVILAPIPVGASIKVNGVVLDTMDESGIYEVTPRQAGRYSFTIAAEGYYLWEGSFEASA